MLTAHFHDAAGVCSRQWRNFGLFKIMAMHLSHCVLLLNPCSINVLLVFFVVCNYISCWAVRELL